MDQERKVDGMNFFIGVGVGVLLTVGVGYLTVKAIMREVGEDYC